MTSEVMRFWTHGDSDDEETANGEKDQRNVDWKEIKTSEIKTSEGMRFWTSDSSDDEETANRKKDRRNVDWKEIKRATVYDKKSLDYVLKNFEIIPYTAYIYAYYNIDGVKYHYEKLLEDCDEYLTESNSKEILEKYSSPREILKKYPNLFTATEMSWPNDKFYEYVEFIVSKITSFLDDIQIRKTLTNNLEEIEEYVQTNFGYFENNCRVYLKEFLKDYSRSLNYIFEIEFRKYNYDPNPIPSSRIDLISGKNPVIKINTNYDLRTTPLCVITSFEKFNKILEILKEGYLFNFETPNFEIEGIKYNKYILDSDSVIEVSLYLNIFNIKYTIEKMEKILDEYYNK